MVSVVKRQEAIRAMRGQLRSPGRPWKAQREDRVRFWEAIAGGVSSEDAAAGAGVSPAVGSRWFRQAGGMPPISLGSVSGRYLSFTEREEIAIFCAQGVGVREIGRRLRRCASTISRELRRNAATRSRGVVYRATTAQWHAHRRASRPKLSKLATNDELRDYVADRLGGQIARPDGELVPGPQVRWTGRRHGPALSKLLTERFGSEERSLPLMLAQEESVEVHALRKRGWSMWAIARHVGRDRKTVRAHLTGEHVPGRRRLPSGASRVIIRLWLRPCPGAQR